VIFSFAGGSQRDLPTPPKIIQSGATAHNLQSSTRLSHPMTGHVFSRIGSLGGCDRYYSNENILDRLIIQSSAVNPEFTTAYTSARKIVNTGGGHATSSTPVLPIP